ncbi:hypothetical protein [Cellulomonas massiliensis]|uniref:hypothetical protein n=1 Tax=Cellulomonas massiliensis TaxID=1465811 RepID=UPI000300D9BD|nr:hypothetical protein [Cellulomonas massiliensis]
MRCSDAALHRRRLEARRRPLVGLPEPTWAQVEDVRRAYAPWAATPVQVDSVRPLAELVDHVLARLSA